MKRYKKKFTELMSRDQAYDGLYREISFLEDKGYNEEEISKEISRQVYEALNDIAKESDKTRKLISFVSQGIARKLRGLS